MNLKSASSWRCACGLTFVRGSPDDEALHAREHEEFALGPLIPEVKSVATIDDVRGYGLHRIGSELAPGTRRRLSKVAMVACRTIPGPAGYDGDVVQGIKPFVLSHGDRVVGWVLGEHDRYFHRLSWADAAGAKLRLLEPPNIELERFKIARVWLAANYRGSGLGSDLIRAVAAHEGCRLDELGWELPFTASGAALVRRASPDIVLGAAGDWDSVGQMLNQE